jgi:4-hydroxy-3-methylbut-2-en-1-yl diphosphate synthase IspG/GcpE
LHRIARRKSRQVMVGDVDIGGDARISVQSMTKTDTRDIEATLSQIRRLKDVGCDIVRCAVPDMEAKAIIIISRELSTESSPYPSGLPKDVLSGPGVSGEHVVQRRPLQYIVT